MDCFPGQGNFNLIRNLTPKMVVFRFADGKCEPLLMKDPHQESAVT